MAPRATITKREFEVVFKRWEAAIQAPKIAMHSDPSAYTGIKEYRDIVKLGKAALPYIVEKLEQGVFLMNEAALRISRKKLEDIMKSEKVRSAKKFAKPRTRSDRAPKRVFLSEQEKSALILMYLKETD